MNKIILFFLCICYLSIATYAQTTKSYAVTRVIGSNGPQAVPTMAMTIEFHDGYLLLNGIEKYNYSAKNYDGSIQYVPATYSNPTLRTTGILVSNDYSVVRQFTQSSIMGMKIELIYDYMYLGDGYEPAQNYISSSSGNYSGNDNTRDWSDCSSCGGSGRCKYCDGSGRDEYTRDGRCGVCRGKGKCVGCDGKGGFHY